jgi:excinuclease ABC subunit B
VAFTRGKFRVRGDVIEVYPAGANEKVIRISLFGDEVEKIQEIDSVTGEILSERKHIAIYPASHFVTSRENLLRAARDIEAELDERLAWFKQNERLLEAQRIEQRTRYDLEMMQEMGYCSGIENYSRHLTGRAAGESPFTLVDYFPDDFLIVIDESHVTMPQIHAMYNGDRSRKQSLVDFGFRLPSALDNRPLQFEEFEQRIKQIVYVSATPAAYELNSAAQVAQQIIRPTGLVDPVVEIRPVAGQIDDLMSEIHGRVEANERVLVTTLTKKMAENLTNYFRESGIRVKYLHSEVETIERAEIIRGLRAGNFDVLVGINLLREGLDLPEVSLIGILDADKEGFLRSDTSLIQTIGRAARNVHGKVIMYADRITNSMQRAIDETDRRRAVQQAYNLAHGITPTSIQKKVRDLIQTTKVAESPVPYEAKQLKKLSKKETLALVAKLEKDMRTAAKNLEFERAAELRDMIFELREHSRK